MDAQMVQSWTGGVNSPITWVGGKRSQRHFILPLFPAGCDRYIEVFFGAGWIFFHKPRDKFEVINDFNSNLVNMYRVIKERPVEFLRELNFLTLNSRDDFTVLKDICNKEEINDEYMARQLELTKIMVDVPDIDELKRILSSRNDSELQKAVAFFKMVHFSFSSNCKTVASTGIDIRKTFYNVWQAHRQLANAHLDNRDFEAVIRHYDRPNSLFFCDPPYYKTEKYYEAEFKRDDHIRLRDTLATIEGKCLITYNDDPFICDLYSGEGFYIVRNVRINNMAQQYEPGKTYAEVIIANYDFAKESCGRQIPQQLSFFDNNYKQESGVIVA